MLAVSGFVYQTTISLVSAIISVLIVVVRPFVYTTTVKSFPVSAKESGKVCIQLFRWLSTVEVDESSYHHCLLALS